MCKHVHTHTHTHTDIHTHRFKCIRRAVRPSTRALLTVLNSCTKKEALEMSIVEPLPHCYEVTHQALSLSFSLSLFLSLSLSVSLSLYLSPCTDVPASACYFGTYEGLLRYLTPKGQRLVPTFNFYLKASDLFFQP